MKSTAAEDTTKPFQYAQETSGEGGVTDKAVAVGKNSLSDIANRASHSLETDTAEGPVAKAIEKQTAKLPSDIFLWAGLGSIVLSATMQLSGRKHASEFVAHWAPTFLILGLYNKLVKIAGSDQFDSNKVA